MGAEKMFTNLTSQYTLYKQFDVNFIYCKSTSQFVYDLISTEDHRMILLLHISFFFKMWLVFFILKGA